MGNGINPEHWWAKGSGAEMELGKTLAPLEPLKTKINVINGLFNKPATGLGIHPPRPATCSPACRIAKGAIIHSGISMDQVLANHIGQETAAAEPRPRLRAADDRLPRDQLLDGLQLAHLLAERRLAGAERGLSLARVRQPVREPRQPAQPQHPRPRQGPRVAAQPPGQLERQGQARRIPDQRPRSREAHRADARRQGQGRRPRRRHARCSRWSAPTTACPKTSASTRG